MVTLCTAVCVMYAGLHSYSATMELRNQRASFWSQQFTNLYCKEGAIGK